MQIEKFILIYNNSEVQNFEKGMIILPYKEKTWSDDPNFITNYKGMDIVYLQKVIKSLRKELETKLDPLQYNKNKLLDDIIGLQTVDKLGGTKDIKSGMFLTFDKRTDSEIEIKLYNINLEYSQFIDTLKDLIKIETSLDIKVAEIKLAYIKKKIKKFFRIKDK